MAGKSARPSVSRSKAWCSGGTPWARMPPPTRNMAAVPATDSPFISQGAPVRMALPGRVHPGRRRRCAG